MDTSPSVTFLHSRFPIMVLHLKVTTLMAAMSCVCYEATHSILLHCGDK
jgi:hypothetical protein